MIDRTLELAKRHDLKIGIKVMCWNLPADLKQRMLSSKNEQGACPPNTGEAMERLTAMWRAIAKRYAGHPQVIWYTASVGLNDGPLHGSFTAPHSVRQCFDYSPDNAKGWPAFLQQVLPFAEVKKQYQRDFRSWDEVPLPNDRLKYDPKQHPAVERNVFDLFMQYNAQGVTRALTGLWNAIREEDTQTPILWKAGGGYHERVPKGFEYETLLDVCKKQNVIFTSTATPSLTGEPFKIEFARLKLPRRIMAGEVGAEGERFPAPPLCTSKCFYLTMRYDMPIQGFCVYPSDVPCELWGYIKALQCESRGFQRLGGKLRIYGDTDIRTYSQCMLDLAYVANSPLRQNMLLVEEMSLPFSFIYDCNWTESLSLEQVLYDPGTPVFPSLALQRLQDFVAKGGQCILAPTSGCFQPGEFFVALRQQAKRDRNSSVPFLRQGNGTFYLPENATEFALLAEHLGLRGPLRWDGKQKVMFSILQNAVGKRKVLLFNPGDTLATGRLSLQDSTDASPRKSMNVQLAPAGLKLLEL